MLEREQKIHLCKLLLHVIEFGVELAQGVFLVEKI